MRRLLLAVAFFLLTAAVVSAQIPSIGSISPTSGTVGTTVTINGANFDATASNNRVFFGHIEATVVSATTSQLTVTVPSGASYHPISVLTGGLIAYSTELFNTTFSNALFSIGSPDDYSTGSSPQDIETVDLDGDGVMEIVSTNLNGNTLSILTQSGGAFTTSLTLTTGSKPYGLAVGDLNGDGKPDIAVANQSSSSVSVFQNTSTAGSISFTSLSTLAVGSSCRGTTMTDLDNDGRTDLLVVNQNSGSVSILMNNTATTGGTISFEAKNDVTGIGTQPQEVVVGDFDKNGKMDFAVAVKNSSLVRVVTLDINKDTGSSVITSSMQGLAAGSQTQSITVGDFDGDGWMDLAACDKNDDNVSVFLNLQSTAAPSFDTRVNLSTADSPFDISAGDLNGDGLVDIITANSSSSSNGISIFYNESTPGTLSFATGTDLSANSGSNPKGLTVGDINGDGALDVLTANTGGGDVGVWKNVSAANDFLTFSFAEQASAASIDAVNHTISIAVGNSEDLTSLTPSFTLSSGASASIGSTEQESGTTANDYSADVVYTVTAENGATQDWTISVTKAPVNTETDFLSFSISGELSSAVINTTDHTITGEVYNSADKNFTPEFSLSYGASASVGSTAQTSGSSTLDFTSTVTYQITAEDGITTENWEVTLNFTDPIISSFSPLTGADGATVTIDGQYFGATIAENTVFFGADEATVISASSNQLQVTVPAGVNYSTISVTTSGATGVSTESFTPATGGANDFNTVIAVYPETYPLNALNSGDLTNESSNKLNVLPSGKTYVDLERHLQMSDFQLTNATLIDQITDGFGGWIFTIEPVADGEVVVTIPGGVLEAKADGGRNNPQTFSYFYKDGTLLELSSSESGTVYGTFQVTFTFDEAVTGFEAADVDLTNATISNFNAVSATVYTADITPNNPGNTTTVGVAADVAVRTSDSKGNAAGNTLSFLYDNTVGVAVSWVSVGGGVFTATITFDRAVTGFEASDLTLVNGTASNFAGSGANYTVDLEPITAGDITLDIASGVVQDSYGNDNTAATQQTLIADVTPPTVNIAAPSPVNGAFTATITFDENVTGFEVSDITVGNGTASNFAGSDANYTVDITPNTEGNVTLDIAAAAAQDAAGNDNTAANQTIVLADFTRPGATISASSPVIGLFTVNISFDEPVTGLELGEIPVGNGTASNLTGSGTDYTVDITPDDDGDVIFEVNGSAAQDAAGNNSIKSNQLTVLADLTPPGVTISASATVNKTFRVDVTFEEEVTGFELADLVVTNGTTGNFTGSGRYYTIDVTPISEGDLTLDIAAGAGQDAAGNDNTVASQQTVTYDLAFVDLPVVNILTADDQVAVDGDDVYGTFEVIFEWDEDVSDFDLSDIVYTGSSAGDFTQLDDHLYSLMLTPTGSSLIEVSIPVGSVTNSDGNLNVNTSRTFNYISSTITSITSTQTGPINTNSLTFRIEFSQGVNFFKESLIAVSNGVIDDFSYPVSKEYYIVEVTPSAHGDVTLLVPGGVVEAPADGSRNTEASLSIFVDYNGPILTPVTDFGDTYYIDPAEIQLSFDEEPTGFDLTDITVTNGSLSNLTGSGTDYTAELTADSEGLITLSIPANAYQDGVGNNNAAQTFSFTKGGQIGPEFISTPLTTIDNSASSTYQYIPEATDANGDVVSYAVTTLPAWLSLDEAYSVTTLAADDFAISSAKGVAVDSEGSLYVANTGHHVILKYDKDGNQSIYAGQLNSRGLIDASIATDAKFRSPGNLIFDNADNLYVVDQVGKAIRKISPTGEVTTVAGANATGLVDGIGTNARFEDIRDITIDHTTGDLYTTSWVNKAVRKIATDGTVSTPVTGLTQSGGIAMDSQGNLFVNNYRWIMKVAPDNTQTLFAGHSSISAYTDGTGGTARFSQLRGMSIDADDNLYVNDYSRIRKITPAAEVTTLAGSTSLGTDDGFGTAAGFWTSYDLAVDAAGDIYVADQPKSTIRKIEWVQLLQGSAAGYSGDFDVVVEASDGINTATEQAFTINVTNAAPIMTDFDFWSCTDCYQYSGVARPGSVITASVEYDEPVFVTGSPYIELDFAGNNLVYASGSGTNTLDFEWTVGDDLNNNEAITYTGIDALKLNGGTIQDAEGVDAPIELDDGFEEIYLDNFTLSLKSITTTATTGSYGIGDQIDITFELEQVPSEVYYLDFIFNVKGDDDDDEELYAELEDGTDFDGANPPTTYTYTYTIEEGHYTESYLGFPYSDYLLYMDAYYESANGDYGIDFYDNVDFTDPDNPVLFSDSKQIRIDGIRPTAIITTDTDLAAAFVATFTFDEEVTGLELGDIVVTNGTASNLSGSGKVYTADITPTAAGALSIGLGDDAVEDLAGNGNTAATTIDVTAIALLGVIIEPTYDTGVDGLIGSTLGGSATITFTDDVSGFEQSDIVTSNLSITSFTANSGLEYAITFEAVAEGSATIDIPAAVAANTDGTGNEAAVQVSMTADLTAPTVILSEDDGYTRHSSISIDVAFSEEVFGLEATDFVISRYDPTPYIDGDTDTYELYIDNSADGSVTVDLPAGAVTDAAGNANVAATQYTYIVDRTAPTLSITTTAASVVAGSFDVTYTFSETVTDFGLEDINLTNATISGFTGSGTSYSATLTPIADGLVNTTVPAGVVEDAAGNSTTVLSSLQVTANISAPTVTISRSTTGPVGENVELTIAFDETVTGLELDDFTVSNGEIVNLTGSGSTYTITLIPESEGTASVQLNAKATQDEVGNDSEASSLFSVTVDFADPVATLSTSESSPSNADSYTVNVLFSENVTGLETTDFTVSNGSVSDLSGSDNSYSLVFTPAADGNASISLAASAVEDWVGKVNEASNELTIVSDRTAPTVTVSSSEVGPVNGAYTVTITFSEGVNGFELDDLILGNALATDLSGTNTVYTATITPITDGDVTVQIGAGAVTDSAGNENTISNEISIEADLTNPTVTLSTTESSPTNATSFSLEINFSESVTGFELSDINVTNGAASSFSGSGAAYTAQISPLTDGEVTVNVGAGSATDEAGNGNELSSSLSLVYDNTAPSVSITSSASDLVYSNSFDITFTFNESVTGFDVSDIDLTNGTASNFAGSGQVYTVEISPVVDGEVSLFVPANVATDAVGLSNTISSVVTKTVEATNEAPTNIELSNAVVVENEEAGLEVGALTASDPDLGDSHTFLLVTGAGADDNDAFRIIGTSLFTKESFDYETQSNYSIRVRATDHQGLTLDEVFTISVTNVDEPAMTITIPDPDDAALTVSSMSFNTTSVGQTSQRTFTVSNSGPDGTLTVSAMTLPTGFTADETSFSLEAGESQLVTVTFTPTAEQTYSGNLEITANTGNRSFAIAGFGEVNQAPVAITPASAYHYNTGGTIQLSGYDPDGDAIGYEVVVQPSLGTLTATGNAGEYTFTPNSLSPETLYTDALEFKVVETDGDLESETATFEFTFEVADAAHTITDFSAGEISNDSRTLTLSFDDVVINDNYQVNMTYYDLSDLSTATLVTLKSETVSKSDLTLTATGADYSFDISSADFDYLFSANQVFLSATLSTSNGFSDNDSFILTNSTDPNSSSVFIGDEDGQFFVFAETTTVPENNTATVKINAVDLGGFDLSNATFDVTSAPASGTLGLPNLVKTSTNLKQWSITYDSDTEVGLTDAFDYEVYSPTRNSEVVGSANIEVIEVNDAPVLAAIADQQTNEDQSITIPVSIDDPDSEVNITVASSETTNVLVIVDGNNLIIDPAANFNGTANITVLVTETGESNPLSTYRQFALTIVAVDDKPVVNAISDLTMEEDGQVVITLSATDVDANLPIFDFSALSDQPGVVEVSIEGEQMTIKPIENFNGTLNFSVFADDQLGTNTSVSDAESFSITVEAVNDAPVVEENFAVQTLVQGFPTYSLDLAAYFSDVETASEDLTYTVSSISNVALAIDGSIMDITTVAGEIGVQTATVTASDGTLSASQSITFVTSEASGEVTVSKTLDNLSLVEDFDMVSIDLSDVFTYSRDAGATFSYGISGNNNLEASMNGTTLEITTPANFNGSDIIYIVGSTDGESAFTSFSITVSAVNDAPELVNDISDFTATEDELFFKSVALSTFSDVDGDDLTFAATFDAPWLNFDAASGAFSGIPTNDYVGVTTVTMTATDPSGQEVSTEFDITVLNTNDAPSTLTLSNDTLDENEEAGFGIGTFSTTDVDADDSFVYALVSGDGDTDNASFNIVGNELTTAGVLDYETQSSYSIRVETTDASGASAEETFTITLNNENEGITDIALSNNEINENVSTGTLVGSMSSVDPDAGDTFTYILVAGEGDTDNDLFELNGSALNTAALFDFESGSIYNIRVRSTDAGGLYYEEAFNIIIDDVNEVPTQMSLSNAQIKENLSITSAIGVFSTVDEDLGDQHSYTLVTGDGDSDNDKFSTSGNALRVAALLDYESQSTYQIRVRAQDNGGLFIEQQYTISLTDVNEAPSAIALSANSIDENEDAGTSIGDLTTTDEDANDSHSYALVTGDGDTDNDSFSIVNAELVTNEAFDYETQSSYSIRVRTTDSGGLSTEQQYTINLNNVNEAPTAIALSANSIDENEEAGTSIGDLTTTDEDANDSHSYSLVSGDGDADNASFSIVDSELQTAESFDFETKSSYSVRVRSTDAAGLSFEQVFSISVNDVVEAVAQIRVEGDLTFEATGLGEVATLDFTIFNDGTADLNISGITFPEAYSGNWSGGVIAAGASQVVTVSFQPTEEQAYTGNIEISSDLGTTTLAVTGEGSIITSIDDPFLLPIEVRTYPNPATDELKIDLSQLNGKPAVVSIWSINGNPKASFDTNGADSVLTIDVRSYLEGVYLLRVESAGKTTIKKVMIKR